MAEPGLLLALYALNVVTMPWVVVALVVNVVQFLRQLRAV